MESIMKLKINMDFIKKIGKDKLILICVAVAVLIICLIWEEKNKNVQDKTESDIINVSKTDSASVDLNEYMEKYANAQEEKLKSILSKIDGDRHLKGYTYGAGYKL